jgi:hypothetical protein
MSWTAFVCVTNHALASTLSVLLMLLLMLLLVLLLLLLLLLLLPEYPHMGLDSAAPVEQGLPLSELFWGGKTVELEGGRNVIGQVWPKVRDWETDWQHDVCFGTIGVDGSASGV